LQRLFSTFPDGSPGGGLLCLRLGAAVPLILYGIKGLPAAPQIIEVVAAVLLLAGLWTPFTGAAIAADELWIGLTRHGDPLTHLTLAALGAGLALLGPGAWSVDARLFGRKRLDMSRSGMKIPPPK